MSISATPVADDVQRRVDAVVQRGHGPSGLLVVGADHRERGALKSRIEVPSRRNSGFIDRPKSTPARLPLARSERRTGQRRGSPGQDRAADDDRVALALLPQRLADLRADAFDVTEIEVPVRLRRRADADQGD